MSRRSAAAGARRRLVLLAVLLLSACSSVPETHYYVLGTTPAAAPPRSDGIALGVAILAADPPYDQDQLVYRVGRDATEIGLYSYHRWVAPPGQLLQLALCKGLADLPGVASVEPVTLGGDYAARLEGRIVLLEEVDLPGSQVARLHLALKLVAGGETLWTRELDAEVPGQTDEVAGIVDQMQAAFEEVLSEVRSGLGEVLRR